MVSSHNLIIHLSEVSLIFNLHHYKHPLFDFMKLPLDEKLIARITEMALAGSNHAFIMSELKKCAAFRIEELNLVGTVDPSDPRFYPSEVTVHYWRRQAHLSQRLANFDNVAVSMYVGSQKQQHPEDNWFLQLPDKEAKKELFLVVQVGNQ
jgi:hypothetical protein